MSREKKSEVQEVGHEGGWQFREERSESKTVAWCWLLFVMKKRDCVAVISFIFLEEVILAVARTESSTFSLYRCSGVRAVGIWCSFNKQHSCCCRGRQASGYCSCSPSPSGISVQMNSLDCSMLPCSTFPFRSFFLNFVFLKIPK